MGSGAPVPILSPSPALGVLTPPSPPQHQLVSQPGLNRGLILDLLDKLRNPGKGAPGGEIEDEEPEVRAPWLTNPWNLLPLFRLERSFAASLRKEKAREEGAWAQGWGCRGYGRDEGSRLCPQGGGGCWRAMRLTRHFSAQLPPAIPRRIRSTHRSSSLGTPDADCCRE